MSTSTGLLMTKPSGGNSCVIGPDGRVMTQPLDPAIEGFVYADLEFGNAVFARSLLDVTGHYSRPDLLWLGVDTSERKVVEDRRQGRVLERRDGAKVNWKVDG